MPKESNKSKLIYVLENHSNPELKLIGCPNKYFHFHEVELNTRNIEFLLTLNNAIVTFDSCFYWHFSNLSQ